MKDVFHPKGEPLEVFVEPPPIFSAERPQNEVVASRQVQLWGA